MKSAPVILVSLMLLGALVVWYLRRDDKPPSPTEEQRPSIHTNRRGRYRTRWPSVLQTEEIVVDTVTDQTQTPCEYHEVRGRIFSGNDSSEMPSQNGTVEDCLHLCSENTHCAGFVRDGLGCFFKGPDMVDSNTGFSINGSVVGYRKMVRDCGVSQDNNYQTQIYLGGQDWAAW
jgi:hypothetical protein